MNKKELVAAMAKETGFTKADAERALNAFTKIVSGEMKKKRAVRLLGFGTFDTRKRASRKYCDVQTGKMSKIPAVTVPRFKAGKALKELVKKK